MSSIRSEYWSAVRSFSKPARQFLVSTCFAWTGHGMQQVLFNLYLVQAGFRESFVGQAVSANALGLALMAIPAGILAERWGKRTCLVWGALIEAGSLGVRAAFLEPNAILAASFVAGVGQAMLAIAAVPFLTEHSGVRERTHLFSSYFAIQLLAQVTGSAVGGALPKLLGAFPALAPDLLHAYRVTLLLGATLAATSVGPISRIQESRGGRTHERSAGEMRGAGRLLVPIAANFLIMGLGAGLVIPFMNLYFSTRFACSSAQIGLFFSLAQVTTAAAAMLAPLMAGRFGKLEATTTAELLSLPFLVTLGAEHRLDIAVGAFVMRATLMQASSPLLQSFVMEALPPRLRSRSMSLNSLVWNIGWASSATLSGWIIQNFGYDVPFYVTATLYALGAIGFYLYFRGRRPAEDPEPAAVPAQDAPLTD